MLRLDIRRNRNQLATFQYVELGDTLIGLVCRWSIVRQAWYMWLRGPENQRLAGPIKLVPGIDLLLPYKYIEGVPQGRLFMHGDEANLESVDVTSILVYDSN